MKPALDVSLHAVLLLAWGTLAMVLLLVLGLLLLRWVRWRNAPRRAAFQALWRARLIRCALVDTADEPLPTLKARDRWDFMKLWLHCQMSLQGPPTARLAALGRTLGCGPMAMRKLGSRYAAERLMAILALGFLKDASAQAALQSCLLQASSQTAVHAARALLEIDASRHANQVASALLARSDLDLSLVSAMLKPFREPLRQALLTQLREDPSLNDSASALLWLRLSRALKLQLPAQVLSPFMRQGQDAEVLMAALRLAQGEGGTADVVGHAQHPNWQVRAQVAQALGRIGGLGDADVLVRMTTDAQWWVRYRAAQALLHIPALGTERVRSLVVGTADRYAIDMLQAVLAENGSGT